MSKKQTIWEYNREQKNASEVKCKHCGKRSGVHLAKTQACPIGQKTRIGYTNFSQTQKFEQKP